ncbi:hypothetical protein POTOM_026417 [Populus tomentosa]|uniref:Uncharacterized protein n=1 Tax=Populus tomentosa TaxID=118781 RepID=A0A8X7ZH05_POPTO|nr:hypothetical protein POTOM_026417 [Populus tomentosa]
MRSLDKTASLFNVDNDAVKRSIDGFLIMINCSCLAEHRFFTWHMDYKVQKGDTWESISSKFGFFVLAMSENVLIPSVIVTPDVLCGCSNNADMVTYKVQNGDTVFTICSRFKAKETKTFFLNGLDNPDIIRERDILFIPTPAGFNNLTSIDYHNQDTKTKKTPKSRIFIVVGAISAALVVDVAIKQMKDTNSKEFLSELNTLCKVHHINLIELIGYAAGGEYLFLVYEYAQHGALSNHLHNPALRDFGLAKLLEQSPDDGGAAASRIAGTFDYLAPEYVRDGHVTAKSDVYSFGVVLMELLTGQPALSKDASPENEELSEHRSVVQYMPSALNDSQDSFDELAKCIDPNLTSYNKDSLYEMALLSKDCVDDNWKRRPDMSRVVLRLSHILSSSREWEEL